ncbi:glycosyltransferase family 4 protein [Sphaerisporangium aureirubrum]|uniref:Glycosyltransferase family 4 protein n=1 Tax=Sphaerisporangium aureirubrum TaxID=1544736 RepID=A0ABW1NFU6_9ACTN
MSPKARRTIARAALRVLGVLNRKKARGAPPPGTGTVRILLLHAYGMGGTIRTTLNLAAHLARTRDVEIISLTRTAEEPFFEIPPGVRVTFLDDRTVPQGPVARRLSRMRSRLVPEQEKAYLNMSLRTDLLLVRRLRSLRGGVLIGTRPAFNLIMALFTPPGVLTIGQEHTTFDAHAPELQAAIRRRYGRLDVFTTLTEADLKAYRKALRQKPPGRLLCVPNAVAELAGDVSRLDEKVVVGIGRVAHAKGFDRLVNAWKTVAAAHPGWRLHIYGGGTEEREQRLRDRIDKAGLTGVVTLMGSTREPGIMLSKASIHAVASRYEGFGMTILEAMSKGVPVVSFDCPHGPREIITDGHDGLLVRSDKAAALGRALCRLIEDEDLRRTLGANALRSADRYTMASIGPRWEALLDGLAGPSSDAETEDGPAGHNEP